MVMANPWCFGGKPTGDGRGVISYKKTRSKKGQAEDRRPGQAGWVRTGSIHASNMKDRTTEKRQQSSKRQGKELHNILGGNR